MAQDMFAKQEDAISKSETISQNSEEVINFADQFYKEMNYEKEEIETDMFDQPDLKPYDYDRRFTLAQKWSTFDFNVKNVNLIKYIDHTERRHQVDAQKYLKQNSQLEYYSNNNIKQHVLTPE